MFTCKWFYFREGTEGRAPRRPCRRRCAALWRRRRGCASWGPRQPRTPSRSTRGSEHTNQFLLLGSSVAQWLVRWAAVRQPRFRFSPDIPPSTTAVWIIYPDAGVYTQFRKVPSRRSPTRGKYKMNKRVPGMAPNLKFFLNYLAQEDWAQWSTTIQSFSMSRIWTDLNRFSFYE